MSMRLALNRVKYRIKPVAPFRLDYTVWALRREPANLLDRWDGETYRRVVVSYDEPVAVSAMQSGSGDDPWLEVTAAGDMPERDLKKAATGALERLLGLRIDLSDFYRFVSGDKRLEPLVQRFRGVKPPRLPTIFEAIVNGIACQQVSLTAGIHLLNRLAETYGQKGDSGGRAFPQPADLARLDVAALRNLGFSRQKARAIIELSAAVASVLDLEQLETMSGEDALALLQQLRGVGRWTAEYVLLRGLGRFHVFPGDDIGARSKVRRWLGISEALDYERTKQALAPWAPYAGLIYFHLLLNHLEAAGHLR